jgi:hypothetical protein
MMNIKISDFYNNFKELNIRQETTKTFCRKIKLMICSDLVREYVRSKGFINLFFIIFKFWALYLLFLNFFELC